MSADHVLCDPPLPAAIPGRCVACARKAIPLGAGIVALIAAALLVGCGNKGALYLEPDATLEQQLEDVDRAIETMQGSDIDASLDALEREEAAAEAGESAVVPGGDDATEDDTDDPDGKRKTPGEPGSGNDSSNDSSN